MAIVIALVFWFLSGYIWLQSLKPAKKNNCAGITLQDVQVSNTWKFMYPVHVDYLSFCHFLGSVLVHISFCFAVPW